MGFYTVRRAIIGLAGLPPDGGGPTQWSAATPEARRGLVEIFGRGDRSTESTRPVWSKAPSGTLSPDDRRFIAAEALRWAIIRGTQTAQKHRVILAVDDLHAIDGASRNAFSDVIAEPPIASMLLVATHVPSYDPGWNGATRPLSGLPTGIAASLVKGVAHERSKSGAEGRTVPPLYIDQLVRFGLEGGSDPPARMADLISLRIERLPPDARRVLQAIAVIGDATRTTRRSAR